MYCPAEAASLGEIVCVLAQHELCLKAPVLITAVRGFLVLAETYRLTTALRLHALQMVRFFTLNFSEAFATVAEGTFTRSCTLPMSLRLSCKQKGCHADKSMNPSIPSAQSLKLSNYKLCGVQLCFLFQEADMFLQQKRQTVVHFLSDLAAALLIGKAIPIAVAAVIEARSRAAFLRERSAFLHLLVSLGLIESQLIRNANL